MQGGDGSMNVPPSAVGGGTITVHVGPNDTHLEIKDGPSGDVKMMEVTPGKAVTIPVPSSSPNGFFTIRLGDGVRMKLHSIEILTPGP